MDSVYIPFPDTIPVAWGWFQFLLLVTFPLHLLAMNAMLGSLGIGIVQHFMGGSVRIRLAHRIALVLPLLIAFVVNLGVAPLLFLQVLYGQFVYTSSILMGIFWISVIPILILAYYGAYLYDFQFPGLGKVGPWLALFVFISLLIIGYFFTNNMLLMALPEKFSAYFVQKDGTILASGSPLFLPRFLHMMLGSLAVGGLFVALIGTFRGADDPELAERAEHVGMKTFAYLSLINICFGTWYLLSQPRETMLLFMGGNGLATICFVAALLLACFVLVVAFRKLLWPTIGGLVLLVYLMSFMRAWVRSDYLKEYFSLDQLQVIPEYSPLVFFLVTLAGGIVCVAWMLKQTATVLTGKKR